jgi:hypothetical protein
LVALISVGVLMGEVQAFNKKAKQNMQDINRTGLNFMRYFFLNQLFK